MSGKLYSPVPKVGIETRYGVRSQEPVIISTDGDVVLVVEREEGQDRSLFRCDSSRLKEASPYFKTLLESTNFEEGAAVTKQQAELHSKYPHNVAAAESNELPHIKVTYVGQVSVAKSIRPLMMDFLRILHGHEILTAARSPPPVNIANLSIVADRFDAISIVARWCRSKKNVLPRIIASQPVYDEEIYRQRLLTSLFFGNDARLATYSNHLILQGSIMWRNDGEAPNDGLWWDLPRGLEEELQFRRTCIFETILSLQNHVLSLYTSKERQCKLGYDSSPQCDSFQLGEFVKFLTRLGTLKFNGPWEINKGAQNIYNGDIRTLIKDLRATPAYQVDSNHSHCGAKKLLTQGLEFIQDKLGETSLGICLQCWQEARDVDHFWSTSKRPPYFNDLIAIRLAPKAQGACDRAKFHEHARDLFSAEEVNWSSLFRNR